MLPSVCFSIYHYLVACRCSLMVSAFVLSLASRYFYLMFEFMPVQLTDSWFNNVVELFELSIIYKLSLIFFHTKNNN